LYLYLIIIRWYISKINTRIKY